ncbi:MAG: hypothetical protein ABIS50_11795 [Luteolibacter sp.]|uniref:hypothetical protein n=1 Tax=Luteolibacter sp. TaxID=1962973 RepID=UPI0032651F2A
MPRNVEEPPPSRPAYFWWLLANALALCFAVVSWFVCLQIFGNPELPRNYKILKKLGRSPVLKHYTLNEIPNGSSFAPKELYRRYFAFDEKELAKVNSLLLRNYLTNFDNPLLLTYIEGDYQVIKSRKLGPKDFFDPGIVIRAQALVKPDDFTKPAPYPVFIEYVFPTPQDSAADAFKPDDILVVKKSPNCAAVVHVSKIIHEDEPCLLLTVIPIAYEKYQLGATGSFGIEPPQVLRPEAGFPVFKD